MARSSECTGSYAHKVLDRDPHCQRRLITTISGGTHKAVRPYMSSRARMGGVKKLHVFGLGLLISCPAISQKPPSFFTGITVVGGAGSCPAFVDAAREALCSNSWSRRTFGVA